MEAVCEQKISVLQINIIDYKIHTVKCQKHKISQLIMPLSEGFSAGVVMRKVGFSESSVWKTGRQDKPVFHTLESETPTFPIMPLYILAYALLNT